MKAKILALAFALVSSVAMGQTPNPRTATISFAAPTTYTDGTTIEATAVISYNVFQGLQGGTKGKVGTITGTSTTITSGMVGGNTYCFEVSAVIAGQESAHSAEACKLIQPATPKPVVITVT